MTERVVTSSSDPGGSVASWTRVDTLWTAGVLVLATLFFLPNAGERPLRGSVESKSALVARKMLRDGEVFVTSIDAAEINKPPVFYWMVAGVSLLAGAVTEWTVRLPNVLACAGAVALTWVLARLVWGRTTAHVSAAVLATMVQFRWLAQSPRIDSVVTLCRGCSSPRKALLPCD